MSVGLGERDNQCCFDIQGRFTLIQPICEDLAKFIRNSWVFTDLAKVKVCHHVDTGSLLSAKFMKGVGTFLFRYDCYGNRLLIWGRMVHWMVIEGKALFEVVMDRDLLCAIGVVFESVCDF
jgi:hypothetical protein